mgnify:CR=1 FL=1
MEKIKKILLFSIIVIVVGSIMAVIIIEAEKKNMINKDENQNIVTEITNAEPTEDSLRFKKEYEEINGTIREKDGMMYNNVSISEINPIKYINLEELIDILKNKNGIVFLSSATCPYCRASIPTLLSVSKKLNIDTIYYYDISSEDEGSELMQELNNYGIVEKNESGRNVWKIPQLLNIKNGEIVASAKGAMYELEAGQSKYDKLTKKQENDIYNVYSQVIIK